MTALTVELSFNLLIFSFCCYISYEIESYIFLCGTIGQSQTNFDELLERLSNLHCRTFGYSYIYIYIQPKLVIKKNQNYCRSVKTFSEIIAAGLFMQSVFAISAMTFGSFILITVGIYEIVTHTIYE